LRDVLARLSAAQVCFEPTGDVDAFWNVNRPVDLALANDLIGRLGRTNGETA
jgi:molybdopterin-guanine dinucleotide biosynthesis protein A